MGSHAVVETPDMIMGVVGCEGAGWVEAVTHATVGGKPWLLLLGDYLKMSERWTKAKLATQAFAERVNVAGVLRAWSNYRKLVFQVPRTCL